MAQQPGCLLLDEQGGEKPVERPECCGQGHPEQEHNLASVGLFQLPLPMSETTYGSWT